MLVEGIGWPAWLGTPSQVGLLVLVAITLIQVWPKLRQMNIDDRHRIKDGYIGRIRELEKQVEDCRRQCDENEARLHDKLREMQNKLSNEAFQRVQSEISLVNTLIQVVDAPELRAILSALEARQIRLLQVEQLDGPVSDIQGE